MYVLYVCNNAPTYYIHVTYRQTSSQPSIRPSMYTSTYIHACICFFVCTCVSLSLSSFLYAGVPFGRHILICSLYAYSRPVTKALKIFPANNKLKLANTHNFCYMYMCMCTNTHTHANKHMHAYVLTYIRVRVFIHEVRRMREYGNFTMAKLESQCVHVYVNTYIHVHRRIGSLGTQIQTYVHLFVHTFRQKLNTCICILYIYTHTHTYTNIRMNERRRYAYIRSFIHTYIQTYVQAKLYFACASMVAILYFILLHFQCLHVEELTNLFTHSCTKLLLI